MTRDTARTLIADIQAYIEQYVTFSNQDYSFAAALWVLGTYLHQGFDAFPYLVITSHTKRSGKTRFSEVLSFMASNPRSLTGVTPATVFHAIKSLQPTLFVDEAEGLSGGRNGQAGDHMMRSVMNSGYRKGQSIPRMAGRDEVEEWPTYCPKVFVLIGDVYDTLRDRSIIVTMQRGEPKTRFTYDRAKVDGNVLGERAKEVTTARASEVAEAYTRHAGLDFLQDRDEEIWLPLFAVAEVFAPSRMVELQRVAADMATEKTSEARRYVNLQGAEQAAEDDEFSKRLVRDLLTVINGAKSIFTVDALEQLKALPTGPWRKFRGAGLTAIDMANLLSRFGLAPDLIRVGGKKKGAKVARGYRREWVEAAVAKLK